jgi:hypothetical protein
MLQYCIDAAMLGAEGQRSAGEASVPLVSQRNTRKSKKRRKMGKTHCEHTDSDRDAIRHAERLLLNGG